MLRPDSERDCGLRPRNTRLVCAVSNQDETDLKNNIWCSLCFQGLESLKTPILESSSLWREKKTVSTGQVKFLDSWALRTTQCPTLSKGKFQEIIFTRMGYHLAGDRSRGLPRPSIRAGQPVASLSPPALVCKGS